MYMMVLTGPTMSRILEKILIYTNIDKVVLDLALDTVLRRHCSDCFGGGLL
jgi:hypothetical protein